MKHHHTSTTEILADDHIKGERQSGIILLEYGDYECPFCGQAHGEVKKVLQEAGQQLCFVFRNFPLRTVHPHAQDAAEAAEAVAHNGDFWTMHDMLFENQDELEEDDLLEYGFEAGMNPDELARELAKHTYYERVQRDVISGLRNGVNGTPTFFINGVRHNEDYSYQTLMDAIEAARHLPTH